MAEAGAGAVNRTPSPAPGPGVWPGIIGRDHHIWPGPGPGMGINPPPAPGIHGAGNPGRFLTPLKASKYVLMACMNFKFIYLFITLSRVDIYHCLFVFIVCCALPIAPLNLIECI